MRRWIVRILLLVLFAPILYFGATFARVWWSARRDEARPAQAIVVLGAAQYDGRPSPVLRARLDHVIKLWKRRVAPTIVVTGGRASGDRFTEASASASYLHAQGVPDGAILREAQGRTSWDSLASAARFLRARGIRDVVLVSDPFHAARIAAIAHEVGLRGWTSPTRTSPIRGTAELRRMVGETAVMSVAQIIGYRRLVRIERVRRQVQEAAAIVPARRLAPSGAIALHSGVV